MSTPVTDAVFALMELGVSGEALRAALERIETAAYDARFTLEEAVSIATAREDVRHLSKGAERTRRYRERKAVQASPEASQTVTERHEASPAVTSVTLVSPEAKAPQTPKKPNPLPTPPLPPTGEFPPQPKAKPSRRCPASWEPNATTLRIGATEGFAPGEIDRELSKMRAHEFRTARVDWDAVAQNWFRETADRRRSKPHERPDPSAKRAAREDNFGRSLAAAVAVAGARTGG